MGITVGASRWLARTVRIAQTGATRATEVVDD